MKSIMNVNNLSLRPEKYATTRNFTSNQKERGQLIWGDSKKVVPYKWRKNAMKNEDDLVES